MSPRKPTIDDVDDVDDEDGVLEEDSATETDLTLRNTDSDDVALGGDQATTRLNSRLHDLEEEDLEEEALEEEPEEEA